MPRAAFCESITGQYSRDVAGGGFTEKPRVIRRAAARAAPSRPRRDRQPRHARDYHAQGEEYAYQFVCGMFDFILSFPLYQTVMTICLLFYIIAHFTAPKKRLTKL